MNNIDWKPDRHNPAPLHSQILQFMRHKIASGEWPVGYKLPSQRSLAELFGVNRSTVVAAIDEAASTGLLEGKSGGGTRVVQASWGELTNSAAQTWNTFLRDRTHQSSHLHMRTINQAEFEPGMIRLGSCEPSPDLIPHDKIRAILGKLSKRHLGLGYEEPKGYLPLREALCVYLKNSGINTQPSNVLITAGVLQGFQLIAMGLLSPGSVVYLEKPSYLYSLRVFQSFGMQMAGIPLDDEGIELDELIVRHRRQKGAVLITIPTFQNPTGNVMTVERRQQLIQVCGIERLPILEDDVYRELWLDQPPPRPIKAFDQNDLVLYTGGLSKNLSPGLRIGWVVGPEAAIEQLADIKMQTDYGCSSLSQQVAAEIFNSGLHDTNNQVLREAVKQRREVAMAALKKHFSGLATWNCPAGGYFIWMKLKQPISMHMLMLKALGRKLLIHPGHLYEFNSNQTLRISYAYADSGQMENGISILAELVAHEICRSSS